MYTAKLSPLSDRSTEPDTEIPAEEETRHLPMLYVCGSADCGKVGVGECKQLPTQTMVGSSNPASSRLDTVTRELAAFSSQLGKAVSASHE